MEKLINFKKGDTVILKIANSPQMVISKIEGEKIWCTYFDNSGFKRNDEFDHCTLDHCNNTPLVPKRFS
ncbi:MAG: hypothetical protein QM535_16685 [Limnohabitans sp.]|nr:hypothetical protein [Limnohabitans sp.]